MRILRNHVENGNFQKRTQKPAKWYVFQNGEKHKWMQMPMIKWKCASPEIEITRKNPTKSAKIEKSQNRFEINWNSISPEFLRKNARKKWHNFGKVRFTANFEKCQNQENKKCRSFVPILGCFWNTLKQENHRGKFPQNPKTKFEEKVRKTPEFECTFYGLF